jgi:hypothetical protein
MIAASDLKAFQAFFHRLRHLSLITNPRSQLCSEDTHIVVHRYVLMFSKHLALAPLCENQWKSLCMTPYPWFLIPPPFAVLTQQLTISFCQIAGSFEEVY